MKTEIKELINQLTYKAIEGEEQEQKVLLQLKDIEDCLKSSLEQVKSIVLEKQTGPVDLEGYKISIHQGGRYSYKHIDAWQNLNSQLKQIEKEAQTLYKVSASNEEWINGVTGEIKMVAEYMPNKPSIKIEKLK